MYCFEQTIEGVVEKTAVVWPFNSYLTNHTNKEQINDILLLTSTDIHISINRPGKHYSIYLHGHRMSSRERWPTERDGERKSRELVLSLRHDNDDDNDDAFMFILDS